MPRIEQAIDLRHVQLTNLLGFQAGRGKWLVVTTVEEIKPACCFTSAIWAGTLDAKKAAHLEMRGFSLE